MNFFYAVRLVSYKSREFSTVVNRETRRPFVLKPRLNVNSEVRVV